MVFLSTRSVEKVGYVQREFRRALYHAEEKPEGFIHTIPVKLDDCMVPSRFNRHQWVKLYEEGAFQRVVAALRHGLHQRGKPLPEPLPEPVPEPSFTNSIGMEFVLIPAGTFRMGSPYLDAEAPDNEKPAHRVTISPPFLLGRYPVTQTQRDGSFAPRLRRLHGVLPQDAGRSHRTGPAPRAPARAPREPVGHWPGPGGGRADRHRPVQEGRRGRRDAAGGGRRLRAGRVGVDQRLDHPVALTPGLRRADLLRLLGLLRHRPGRGQVLRHRADPKLPPAQEQPHRPRVLAALARLLHPLHPGLPAAAPRRLPRQ